MLFALLWTTQQNIILSQTGGGANICNDYVSIEVALVFDEEFQNAYGSFEAAQFACIQAVSDAQDVWNFLCISNPEVGFFIYGNAPPVLYTNSFTGSITGSNATAIAFLPGT